LLEKKGGKKKPELFATQAAFLTQKAISRKKGRSWEEPEREKRPLLGCVKETFPTTTCKGAVSGEEEGTASLSGFRKKKGLRIIVTGKKEGGHS